MRIISLLFLLLSCTLFKAQNFYGEIFIRDTSSFYLNQIYVTNLNDMKTVLANSSGRFVIPAKQGDVIRFTSVVTERKDIKITESILQNTNNFIELKIAYYEIQEIVLTPFKPSGNLRKDVLSLKAGEKKTKIYKNLGIPEPKGPGVPQALPVASLSGGGLTFSVDSIYEILSGERKKKQRLQDYEKMMMYVQNIKNYYGKDYFIKLKIPDNMIDNFLQFVYSSDNLNSYLANGNYEAIQIYIEKFLPIYQKRLRNSNLMEVVK